MLKTWAMFSKEPDNAKTDNSELDLDKLLRIKMREENIQSKKIKIGRNDPCPCGSGKKYKFCCLKKPKDAMDQIESPEERNKWLGSYPYTGQERIQGRIYLEDYFDAASIEIDKILYLALMNRPGWIWNRNMEAEERRKREYLYLVFQKCKARMDSEQIRSFAEYDVKYSIHYLCGEWIGELSRLWRIAMICKPVKKSGNGQTSTLERYGRSCLDKLRDRAAVFSQVDVLPWGF